MERSTATVQLDRETWKDAKRQAIEEETTLTEIMARALREYLERRQQS